MPETLRDGSVNSDNWLSEISENLCFDVRWALLTLSAISRPWRLHLDFSCQVESNGWISAIKLIARVSGPGHNWPDANSPEPTFKGRLYSGTCRIAYGSKLAFADIEPPGFVRRQRGGYLPLSHKSS